MENKSRVVDRETFEVVRDLCIPQEIQEVINSDFLSYEAYKEFMKAPVLTRDEAFGKVSR